MNLLPKRIRQLRLPFRDFLFHVKNVPKYFETNISHLPVNNIGENIQSLVFYGSKDTSSALYENDVTEEIRCTVTS